MPAAHLRQHLYRVFKRLRVHDAIMFFQKFQAIETAQVIESLSLLDVISLCKIGYQGDGVLQLVCFFAWHINFLVLIFRFRKNNHFLQNIYHTDEKNHKYYKSNMTFAFSLSIPGIVISINTYKRKKWPFRDDSCKQNKSQFFNHSKSFINQR